MLIESALNRLAAWGVCIVLALVLLLPGLARAQVESREGIALQNQILELRREVQQLSDQLGRSGSPTYLGSPYGGHPPNSANDLTAQLLARVTTLEEQVRELRGRVDEMQNQVQQQGADLNKKIDDLAFQMQNPGTAPAPGAPPRPPAPGQPTALSPPGSLTLTPPPVAPGVTPPPTPPAAQPPRTPELAMQEGNAALARRDYMAAEQDAREVLNTFRTSPRAYDAQFLLAQALAGQRQFSQAAIAYDDTYNRSRKGAHAQDALLGLANSLLAINEKKAACETLGKLRTDFPTLKPDLRAGAASATQRGACR
jgi:TolA-binding protein